MAFMRKPRTGKQDLFILMWLLPKPMTSLFNWTSHQLLGIPNKFPLQVKEVITIVIGYFHLSAKTTKNENIHPIFVSACMKAGFLIHAEYENKKIQFSCNYSKYHNVERERKQAAKRERNVKDPSKPPMKRDWRRSSRPQQGKEGHVLCKFKFCVYYDDQSKRWFLPFQQMVVLIIAATSTSHQNIYVYNAI